MFSIRSINSPGVCPPYTHSSNKIKVKLDFSKYAEKSDLKNAISVDASKFAKKADISNLKPHIDKLKK